MWATADTDVDFPITFMVDDDFVLPTAAAATVRNAQGVQLLSETLTTTSTSTYLRIPAAMTSIPAGKDFEVLFIQHRFTSGGRVHEERHTLNLVPFLPLSASPKDVRQALGLPSTELADDQIQILPAFFRLKTEIPTLRDTLEAGGVPALNANRMVVLEAALALIPTLQVRIGQKIKSDDQEFARFAAIDWEQISMALEGELVQLKTELTGLADEDAAPRFMWAIPTDPITGGA